MVNKEQKLEVARYLREQAHDLKIDIEEDELVKELYSNILKVADELERADDER